MSERSNGFVDWARGIGMPWWGGWNRSTDPELVRNRSAPDVIRTQYPFEVLREIWRADALVARVIERPADDMTRQGWRVQTDNAQLDEYVRGRQEELRAGEALKAALEYMRAFGGGALLLGLDDKRSIDTPLAPQLAGKLQWLIPLSPEDLFPYVWDEEPGSPTFEQPTLFRLSRGGRESKIIHRSRLVVIQGRMTGYRHRRENQGWGDSIIPRVLEPIKQYALLWAMVAEVLKGHSQPVVRLDELYELFERPGGKDLVKDRIEAIALLRSNLRMLVLDKKDEFGFITQSLAEIVNILREHAIYLSAVCDFPVTLLMGMSPAGLNATGDSDIRNYYDRKRSEQTSILKPALETLTNLLLREVVQQVPNFRITFNPLWQPTEKEQAETRLIVAQTDALYIGNGVRDPEQVARSRDREGGWSMDTEPLEPQVAEKLEQAALQKLTQPNGVPGATPRVPSATAA